ncbi:MAG TPA: DUF1549 domain-containing protein, partial [Pirellulales bacterium]|nr:DUF1549 domain-containing protein [Pirellulales bacterium]
MLKVVAWFGFALSLAVGAGWAADEPAGDLSARIDTLVDAACQAGGAVPAGPCDDATFLRRVSIDLAGRVPSVLAARDFLDDATLDKRAALVDRLLAGEEFADHWGRVLTEIATDRRAVRQPPFNGRVLQEYLRDALARDRSYQQIVRELIASEGAGDSNGPVNFLLRYEADPAKLTGAVANKFLGVSLECAQCHHHPFDRWTQDDFWGIAACFARTKQVTANDGELFGIMEARRGEMEIDAPAVAIGGEQVAGEADARAEGAEAPAEPPSQKKQVAPRLLDGTPLTGNATRRAELAEWITSERNDDFARQAVNAVWGRLFSNPLASDRLANDDATDRYEAELLDTLATGFVADGYSLKRLLRVIVLSRAYGRDSASAAPGEGTGAVEARIPGGVEEPRLARFRVRPLSVDELYQSVVQASGYAGGYEEMEGQPGDPASDPQSFADPAVELLGQRALTV